jgi:outer membrane protein assembly factor BamB
MKIQCSCGAKYAFDITPEMASQPVSFVCPACGQDSSEIVNQLVREELAAPAAPPPVADAPAPLDASPPSHTVRMRVVLPEKPAAPAPAIPVSSKFCAKHHGERTTETCAICGKPICPKCLALFGYFCSPLCKGKAEAQLIDVPVYAGRKDVADARFWRKTGWVIGATATVMVLALGVWTWYAWFGSVPHSYFSVRFENDRAYSGRSQLVGRDQMVFLHGGTLARYDWKTKKPVWSQELVTKPQIAELVKAHNDLEARLDQEYSGGYRHRQTQDQVEKSAKRMLEAALSLHVSGQNIWVGKAGQLTRYDWDSGKVLREIARPEGGGELVEKDGELLVLAAQSVTHISLASGDTRVESFGAAATAATAVSARNAATGGLPGTVADNGRLLNPQKVEAQAQNLKLPARIALPALLANAAHERQLEAALNGDPQHPRSAQLKSPAADAENFQLISGEKGWVQFSSRLLEEHFVTRSAMKAPPQKSVINGDLNASKSTDAANEILNEMQRNRGGDSVTEDESRYQVTVHLPDSAGTADWTGEVVGPPQLFALKSVNVIVAGKTVIVLDPANKKLWQAALTYPVSAGDRDFAGHESQYGAGPCAEHGDTLYIFDQAVLSAFELSSGNARWRLPSIGVVGLFFDDSGCVYVNTTTGNPDDIKYSRQIDISRKTEAVLLKLDPQTGKTLWRIQPGGYIVYLSGKFIYTLESYDPNPTDEEVLNDMTASLQKPPFLHLARIRPADGRVLWEYYQDRCPIDVRFDQNAISLVFKREVQLLRYLTF